MQIICGAQVRCGFRVHSRYFAEKSDRFAPYVCPRCNGPIAMVEDHTEDVVDGAVMEASGRIREAGG